MVLTGLAIVTACAAVLVFGDHLPLPGGLIKDLLLFLVLVLQALRSKNPEPDNTSRGK